MEADRELARTPRIDAIDIAVDPTGLATLSVQAIDLSGRALVYKWGSRALEPVVISADEVTIDARNPEPGTLVAHIAVQDAGGELAAGRVEFYRDAICAVCGEHKIWLATPMPEDEPCVYSHRSCVASCPVEERTPLAIEPTCAAECAGRFALCRTNPS